MVQLYLSAPSVKFNKPTEELKGFAKTDLLQAGQKQTISFVLNSAALASFYTNSTSRIAEAGKYQVKIGTSSTAIKQTATFNLVADKVVEKCNKVLVPPITINELKN